MGTTNEPKTADLVAASVAADSVKNGKNDIAVFEAGKAELLFRCDADCEMIRDEREFLLRKAKTYDATGRPGYATGARKQADELNEQIKLRREAYSAALALFATKNGFASLMPADEIRAAASAALRKQYRPAITMLENLATAGIETWDGGNGKTVNVTEELAHLRDIGIVVAVETVENSSTEHAGNVTAN